MRLTLDDLVARWSLDPSPAATRTLCERLSAYAELHPEGPTQRRLRSPVAGEAAPPSPHFDFDGSWLEFCAVALDFAAQAQKESRSDAHALLAIGRLLLHLDEPAKAQVAVGQAARLAPFSVEALRLLGEVLRRRGDEKRAARAFELAAATERKLAASREPAPGEAPYVFRAPEHDPWQGEAQAPSARRAEREAPSPSSAPRAAGTVRPKAIIDLDVDDEETLLTSAPDLEQIRRLRASGAPNAAGVAAAAIPAAPRVPAAAGAEGGEGADEDARTRRRAGKALLQAAGVTPPFAPSAPPGRSGDLSDAALLEDIEAFTDAALRIALAPSAPPPPAADAPMFPLVAEGTAADIPVDLSTAFERLPDLDAPAPRSERMGERVAERLPEPEAPAPEPPRPLRAASPAAPAMRASQLVDEFELGNAGHVAAEASGPQQSEGPPPGPRREPLAGPDLPESSDRLSDPELVTPKPRRWLAAVLTLVLVAGAAGGVIFAREAREKNRQASRELAASAEVAMRRGGERDLAGAEAELARARSLDAEGAEAAVAVARLRTLRLVEDGGKDTRALGIAISQAKALGASEAALAGPALALAFSTGDEGRFDALVARAESDPAFGRSALFQLVWGAALDARGKPAAIARYEAAAAADPGLAPAQIRLARARLLAGDLTGARPARDAVARLLPGRPETAILTALASALGERSAASSSSAPSASPSSAPSASPSSAPSASPSSAPSVSASGVSSATSAALLPPKATSSGAASAEAPASAPVGRGEAAELPRSLRALGWALAYDAAAGGSGPMMGLSAAIDDADAPGVATFCAARALRQGDVDATEQAIQKALKLAPGYPRALALRAELAFWRGDLVATEEALAEVPPKVQLALRALVAYERGDLPSLDALLPAVGPAEGEDAERLVRFARDRLAGERPLARARIVAMSESGAVGADTLAADAALDQGDFGLFDEIAMAWGEGLGHPLRALRKARAARQRGRLEEAAAALAVAFSGPDAAIERVLLATAPGAPRKKLEAPLASIPAPERPFYEALLLAHAGELTKATALLQKTPLPAPGAPLRLRVAAALATSEAHEKILASAILLPLLEAFPAHPDVLRAGVALGLLNPSKKR